MKAEIKRVEKSFEVYQGYFSALEDKVKELCIAFGESYATACLEVYKAELKEWVNRNMWNEDDVDFDEEDGDYKFNEAMLQVLSHLNNDQDE